MTPEETLPYSKNIYETIIIFKPHYKDKVTLKDKIQEYKTFFLKKSHKIKFDEMGEKKLAYEMDGCESGYYTLFIWEGTSEDVGEVERLMRIDDSVLKFLTVKQEEGYEIEDAEFISEDAKSEQTAAIDAYDVLLGFAEYKKEVK